MAKIQAKKDEFPNRALEVVTLSAANTITFSQIRFGVGVFQGVALVVHRLEFHPTAATWQEIVANTDVLQFGITNRDDLTTLDPSSQNAIYVERHIAHVSGTPATGWIDRNPVVADFSTLPGQGLIIPANPLYLGGLTAGFTAAATIRLVMYYTFKTLADSDYIELIQGMLPANI